MSADAQKRAHLPVAIANAARLVQPLWPIETFIAVNPLLGLLDEGFDAAAAEAQRWLGARCHPRAELLARAAQQGRVLDEDVPSELGVDDLLSLPQDPAAPPAPRTVLERLDAQRRTRVADSVDAEVARWCATLVDPHGPGNSRDSFFDRWREIAPHDRRLRRLAHRAARPLLKEIPENPDEAVLWAVDILQVADDITAELRGQLARLPGWAAYAKWCDDWAAPADPAPRLDLAELLAVRLTVDALTLAPGEAEMAARSERGFTADDNANDGATTPRTDDATGRLILETLENGFRRRFLSMLDKNPATEAHTAAGTRSTQDSPDAQIVCCIDVRSEGLRRHIESSGPYETLGFAGFFATPIRFRAYGAEEAYPSAPVLLTPEVEIGERPAEGLAADDSLEALRRTTAVTDTFEAVAHGPLSMFQLAEMAGWVTGPAALVRTVVPWFGESMQSRDGTELVLDGPHGFDLESRAAVAETALATMGLTDGFAPLVVLCGHGSTSTANAHASSLDCGACGGNKGGPNARAAADICNDPGVRDALRKRGIDIPAGTWFLAAEHDTTTDEVTLLDVETVPRTHTDAATRLADDLANAGAANVTERLGKLPGGTAGPSSSRRARSRSRDWAETRPEWGLARNAAFVAAPRYATEGLDLDGRAFLHSYDDGADTEGAALETILTAPMVVAHWINSQYYFSTVDPERFGAGDKTLHNPVADIGVLEGAGGDLRAGLAWQSVGVGDEEYHEPIRLLTLVQAPLERIDMVIARNSILQQLFGGSWVHLVARENAGGPWYRRLPSGAWQLEPTAPLEEAA